MRALYEWIQLPESTFAHFLSPDEKPGLLCLYICVSHFYIHFFKDERILKSTVCKC